MPVCPVTGYAMPVYPVPEYAMFVCPVSGIIKRVRRVKQEQSDGDMAQNLVRVKQEQSIKQEPSDEQMGPNLIKLRERKIRRSGLRNELF
jgi:hypothetical protein